MNDQNKILMNNDEEKVINPNNITETNFKDSDILKDDILVDTLTDTKISDYVVDDESLENAKEVMRDQNKKEAGLTSQEAAELLTKYGPNKLTEKKKQSKFFIFFKQLKDVMILLLFIAMMASLTVGLVQAAKNKFVLNDHLIISFIEPFIILIVIVMYCILGGIQELKSQEAVSSLKKLSTTLVAVMRDGVVKKIDATEVVPGDLLLIEAGDRICADGILLSANGLECVESALTGETLPIKKNANAKVDDSAPIGDQINKVFSGCIVTNGQGVVKVIGTGAKTQVGRIANLIDSQKIFMTPLQLKLHKLGKIFGYSGAVLFILVFLIQILILGTNNFSST